MKSMLQIVSFALGIGTVGWVGTHVLAGCGPGLPIPDVARRLSQLAGEVCVEGDSVQVCARKCAEAPEAPAPADSR